MTQRKWNVIVCGTRFGRVYLSALIRENINFKLVGILASGSERSHQCAKEFGVPLYTEVESLPEDVDAACVIVSSEMGGGVGTQIALQLLERGVHVLQEHPIHHDELVKLITTAKRNGVIHRMNTLYPSVHPIQQFINASKNILQNNEPLYLDGACAIQLKTSFFDIIGRILGKLRPWRFEVLSSVQNNASPWRSIEALIGGTPCFLRIQNQIHALDPDNHCHLYHQLTVGSKVGSLTLADTHGPVLWRPRPHIPESIQNDEPAETCQAPSLDFQTSSIVLHPETTWRQAMTSAWPKAALHALEMLRRESQGEFSGPSAQFSLSLMQMVHELDLALGPPTVIYESTPAPASTEILKTKADF